MSRLMQGICSVVAVMALATVTNISMAQTLSIGWTTADSETDPYAITAHYFAEELEKIAPDAFDVAMFPNHQLGNEIDMLQQMQLGTLAAGVITSTQVASIVPAFQLNDLPFLYATSEQAHDVLDGAVGQALFSQLAEKGIVGLGFSEAGFRNVINNVRPIYKPSDLEGIKLRVQPSQIFISSFDALGANPVPMAWSSTFTAVQQGTVDGLEIPLAVIYSNKYAEVTKNLSLTRHAYNALALVVSKSFFSGLSPELQKAVRTAAERAIDRQRDTVAQNNKIILEELQKAGMQVNEIEDVSAFRKAVKPVYDQYSESIGPKLLESALDQVGN